MRSPCLGHTPIYPTKQNKVNFHSRLPSGCQTPAPTMERFTVSWDDKQRKMLARLQVPALLRYHNERENYCEDQERNDTSSATAQVSRHPYDCDTAHCPAPCSTLTFAEKNDQQHQNKTLKKKMPNFYETNGKMPVWTTLHANTSRNPHKNCKLSFTNCKSQSNEGCRTALPDPVPTKILTKLNCTQQEHTS